MRRYHRGPVLVIDPEAAERRLDLPPRQATREPRSILERAAEELGVSYTEVLDGRLVLIGDAPWAKGDTDR